MAISKAAKAVNKESNKKQSNSKTEVGETDKNVPPQNEDGGDGAIWTDRLSKQMLQSTSSVSVLGCITRVTDEQLFLRLPDGITGVVKTSGVSRIYTRSVKHGQDPCLLTEMYVEGQLVACTVISSDASGLLLSLEPSAVNVGVDAVKVPIGMVLSAAVKSREDTGYSMDIGIGRLRAFLPESETRAKTLNIGQNLLCVVMGGVGKPVVQLSLDPSRVVPVSPKAGTHVSPGTTLFCSVRDFDEKGLHVNLGKSGATAFVSRQCLRRPDVDMGTVVGTRLKCVVLYAKANSYMIGLSSQSHLVGQALLRPTARTNLSGIAVGDLVNLESVMSLSRNTVLLKTVSSTDMDQLYALCTEANCEHVGESAIAAYAGGTQHKARVIGVDLFRHWLLVSTKKSIFKQPVVNVEDAKIGAKVQGVVSRVTPNALFITMYGYIQGFVALPFGLDSHILSFDDRFHAGDVVIGRVLERDLQRNSLRLTLKPSQVQSTKPVLSDYDTSLVGRVVEGVVVHMAPTGMVVKFYNNVRGFLPRSELVRIGVSSPDQAYSIGSLVRVTVTSCNPAEERLSLALEIGASVSKTAVHSEEQPYEPGRIVSGHVVRISKNDGLHIEIRPDRSPGFVPISHLSDGSLARSARLLETYHVGDRVECGYYASATVARLTLKPLVLQAIRDGIFQTPSLQSIGKGDLLFGCVSAHSSTAGYNIELPGNLSAFASQHNVGKIKDKIEAGMTVLARVLKIESDKQRIFVSLALENCTSSDSNAAMSLWVLKHHLSENQRVLLGCVGKLTEVSTSSVVNAHPLENGELLLDGNVKCSLLPKLNASNPDQVISATVLYLDPYDERAYATAEKELMELVRKRTKTSPASGKLVKGRIVMVSRDFVLLVLMDGWIAYLSNLEHPNDFTSSAKYTEGENTEVVVRGRFGKDCVLVQPKEAAGAGIEADTSIFGVSHPRNVQRRIHMSQNSLQRGSHIDGKIVAVKFDRIELIINDCIAAFVTSAEIQDDFENGENPFQRFSVGETVNVRVMAKRVIKISGSKPFDALECTMRPSKMTSANLKLSDIHIQAGSLITLFYDQPSTSAPNCVSFAINSRCCALVDRLHLSTEISVVRDPSSNFLRGHAYRGAVLGRPKGRQEQKMRTYTCTLLPALEGSGVLIGRADLRRVQTLGRIFVKTAAYEHDAGLVMAELCDDYSDIPAVLEKLSKDPYIHCKVIGCDKTGRPCVSIRPSVVSSSSLEVVDPPVHDIESLSPGAELRGLVQAKSEAGDIVSIGATITGLVRSSKPTRLPIGQLVTVRVSNMTKDQHGFTNVLLELSDSVDIDEIDVPEDVNQMSSADPAAEILNEIMETDSRPTTPMDGVTVQPKPVASKRKQKRSDSALPVQTQSDVPPLVLPAKARKLAQDDTATCSLANMIAFSDNLKKAVGESKRGTLPADAQQALQNLEMPKTTDEDVSAWLTYIRKCIRLGEYAHAQTVAERALDATNVRKENDRLKIWSVLLEIAVLSGDDLEPIMERAMSASEPTKIYLRLAQIYRKEGKDEKVDEIMEHMQAKYGHEVVVWQAALEHYMVSGREDLARKSLQKAFKRLERPSDHITLTTALAQLEFRHGYAERGRDLFDRLVSSYPKRNDLWSVYIDMLAKHGSVVEVRNLIERVIGQRQLSVKQSKFFFKKWLSFEQGQGDEETQNYVKQKAVEYASKFVP